MDGPTRAVLEGSLDDCYTSADEALGRVLDAAPPDARVVVFALHGMGPNDGWYEILPRILEQIHRGGGGAPAKPGLLFRLRQALPWTLVRQVTRRIPSAWNQALVPLWSRRMHDWPNTKYFALPMDYNGYVRLNLKGREKQGCVDPGDADRVIAEVDAALRSFRDIDNRQARDPGHDQGGRAGLPHRAAPPLSSRSGRAVGPAGPGVGLQRRGLRPSSARSAGPRAGSWPPAARATTRPMAGSSPRDPGSRRDRAPGPTTPPTSCPPCSSGSARRDRPISSGRPIEELLGD